MDVYDTMTVEIPEAEINGMRIEKFTVEGGVVSDFRDAVLGRSPRPGTYTRLAGNGVGTWMTDTPAEKRDHMWAVNMIRQETTRRVLINGLGLGMVLKAALACEHVEHVDVVEIDERVITLVGPSYDSDPRVTIHHADAYAQAKKWAAGTRWDVVWHDIWPTICEDNLPGMARLHHSYGRRATWQGSWSKEIAESQRDQGKRRGW